MKHFVKALALFLCLTLLLTACGSAPSGDVTSSAGSGQDCEILARALGYICRSMPPYVWERLVELMKPRSHEKISLKNAENGADEKDEET